jgi:hypothetical protein
METAPWEKEMVRKWLPTQGFINEQQQQKSYYTQGFINEKQQMQPIG